jgi:ribosomal protein L40E
MKSEYRQCFKCNYQAAPDAQNCPRCGGNKLQTAGKIRFLGLIQAFGGGFLAVLIAAVAAEAARLGPQSEKWQVHNTRDVNQLYIIFGIFALIFVLGLIFALAGIWQVYFVRRNRFLIWSAVFLTVVVFGGTGIFVVLL